MSDLIELPRRNSGRDRAAFLLALIGFLLLATYFRIEQIGLRSLWHDELCTWHASRMPLGESLRWGPELTKPPAYQLALRAVTQDPHPSESMLRLPAALCGLALLPVALWMGRLAGGLRIGLALLALLAVNALQIFYCREARPYSMLVLGCAISTGLWYSLITKGRTGTLCAYVAVTALTLYAHYLTGLTIVGHAIWWLVSRAPSRGLQPSRTPRRLKPAAQYPAIALVATGALCLPLVIRYLLYKTSMFQGLEWIATPTLVDALGVLSQLTFGPQWLIGILLPATILWMAGAVDVIPRSWPLRRERLWSGRDDICGLLLLWLGGAWFGLLVISWLFHPAMVARYALPAAVPALLFPLVIAHRLDRRIPLVIAAVFAAAVIPDRLVPQVPPGFREMRTYLQQHVDPNRELVVLTIDNTIYPGWEDSERLGFDYYPLHGVPVAELRLEPDGVTASNDILEDPRGMYLIVLWADPFPILEAAGRVPLDIVHDGESFSQLPFEPYRLVRVAPRKF